MQLTKKLSTGELITRLAQTLHECAMPAHELEERMRIVSSVLGMPASFFSTPTSLFVSFESSGETRMVRVAPPAIDLNRLSKVHDLLLSIESTRLSEPDIWDQIETIEDAKHEYGFVIEVLSLGLIGATTAILFGGGLNESVVAAITGVGVGLIGAACRVWSRARYLNEMLASFGATVLASVGSMALQPLSIEITTLASLIVLIPGLSVTVGINELATQNLASGSARLAGALATFLTLAFGMVMGRSLIQLFLVLPQPAPVSGQVSIGWTVASLVVTSLAIGVIFRARPQDLIWVLLAGVIAYFATRLGGQLLAPEAAPWTGAFLLGCASNSFAVWLRRPAAVMLVPGLLLLVPGSFGFFGLQALLNHDVDTAVQAVFSMALIAASIAAGLLMANVVTPTARRR